MEGWPYTVSCLVKPGESGPAGVICTVMNGPYSLPCRTVPSPLARAATLRPEGISSCCYIVNVLKVPSWLKSRMARQGPALHVNSLLVETLRLKSTGSAWFVVLPSLAGEGGGRESVIWFGWNSQNRLPRQEDSSAVSFLPAAGTVYRKCTQPNVITKINHGRLPYTLVASSCLSG